ncbi:hypothetical protein F0243_26395 [Vibrio mediterranei]|nr:hypothetical protein [Vibrio mediterranei]
MKELSNDTKPFKLAKTAFETFRTAATKLGCHKKDSLTGHTHSVTRAYRAELLLLNSAIDFNFDEVIYEQDEQMLFEFFADNDYKATQKFYSLGIIDEPDYNAWNMYKDKHLNSVTKPSFSNAKWGWNVIYQYLAYVSCWCEMFQEQSIEGCISTPATFKELDRETFVIRSYSNQDIDTDQWPRTLGEFLLHKSASVATWVKAALDSVEVNFAFDEDHISSTGKLLLPTEFTNHWHKANNGIQLGTLTESVKRVFTRPEYAVSLSVAYTLEMYGAYLQERVLEGYDYNLLGFRPAMSFHTDNQYRLIEIGPKIRTPAGIVKYQHNSPVNAEKKLIADAFYWAVPLEHYQDVIRVGENNTMALKREINSHVCAGFSPIVWYVNDELTDAYVRLDNTSKIIRNPYSMTNFGTIDIEDTQIVAPLLGPIRGIIVALEQGIRHKHIRYLDKRYFDKYVTEDLVQLLVSTDKSRRQPWKAISHLDVISMLRAERQFQDLRTDVDHLINYNNDGREIDVLFRNASGEAFTETAWSDVWRIFLSISQGVINSSFTNTIDRCEFVKMVPLSETGSMTSQTVERLITAESEFVKRAKVSGKNEKLKFDADGHRVKLLALLTPHSTRTTYVSHRVGYIGLETVRKNIGQIKVFSTVYYNKETDEERARKILEYRSGHSLQVHKPTNNDTSRMRTNDVSQTHVQGAFQENPRETMMVYGFTSIPIVTVDDEGNEITNPTGMDLIESTPLSLIAFAPTHICIHNMECTSKIITENGGYQRCGVCRIKICHIDNLISISRMVQRYELDLKANVTAIIRLNRSKVDDATVHKIEIAQLKREQSILQSELLGWQTALHIIEQTRVRLLNKKHTSRFIVPAPRLLSTTISCKKLSQSVSELFLDHVTNMSDIPSLNSPEVAKTVAKIERRILLESKNASKDVMRKVEACFVSDSLDPRHIMSPIMSMLDAKIITKEQILQVIDNELSPPTLKRSPLQNTVMEVLTANG